MPMTMISPQAAMKAWYVEIKNRSMHMHRICRGELPELAKADEGVFLYLQEIGRAHV